VHFFFLRTHLTTTFKKKHLLLNACNVCAHHSNLTRLKLTGHPFQVIESPMYTLLPQLLELCFCLSATRTRSKEFRSSPPLSKSKRYLGTPPPFLIVRRIQTCNLNSLKAYWEEKSNPFKDNNLQNPCSDTDFSPLKKRKRSEHPKKP